MGWKQNKQSCVSVILFITILTVVGVLSWWTPVSAQTKAGVIKARYSGWAPPPSFVGQVEKRFFDVLHKKVGDRLQVELFQGGTLYKYQ
jgi:hypothetical protein